MKPPASSGHMFSLHQSPPPLVHPDGQQVMELIPEPFLILDGDHRVVAANQAAADLFSQTRGMLMGQGCQELLFGLSGACPGDDACPLMIPFDPRAGGIEQRVEARNHQGRPRPLRIRLSRLAGDAGALLGLRVIEVQDGPTHAAAADPARVVGRSPAMAKLMHVVERVAPTSATVLLLGESGVGKERVAEHLHRCSERAEGPLVVVDCSALGEQLIEAELFGYEKGAFTGADRRKIGLFEAAQGGTLFIDEVGEMPLAMQSKLLRALEASRIRRVGGTDYIDVDARVVAATHRDLGAMVARGEFREDLYYRLAAFPVDIPPLRERREDIVALAEHFLEQAGGAHQLPLSRSVAELLTEYPFPGNVRELKNIISRAAILAGSGPVLPEHIAFQSRQGPAAPAAREEHNMAADGNTLPFPPPRRTRNGLTRERIHAALEASDGHRAEAAQRLGVSERTLYRHLQRLSEVD
ncbi:sigma-54 interaction domain-containing protein [Ectothiorhodospira variabilis]|uniref:sigma-54 interaction domain-containing protein n=1 Tax=Ectothiorhodospira variabilis TaxID=505694 RepID=UPI001EFA60BA|nr:sigma 54-interacting transcriptional regulator [Ectothiorhodospira variabilis]MCG5498968.1 sigma 54-interacting transcriptional regulator [Ectothiorhodospira variabilis]MCG5503198.1 sigma 54-interacting transcriptional regulator [Ectothiorhodospira variabilis]MCG5506043.1 sigma 54-interacting transcriptional regulator [Ectothiorhodospira variabilis]